VTMRVTQGAVTSLMLAGLQANQAKLGTLQQQMSSGKQITKPSDDPVGTDQAMQYRAQLSRNAQYTRNAQDGQAWLGTADNALASGVSVLQRLQTLVTQAANTGSGDSTSRSAIATEVASLKQEMLGVANTTYLGRPIFGGTTSNPAAYVQDASGNVTYQGDTGTVMRTVADGTQVQVNVNSTTAFGAAGSDVFAMFDKVTSDLQGNPGNLTNDLTTVSTSLNQMTNAQATEGSAYNRIADMMTAATNQTTTLTGRLSDVEDVDTAKAATDMAMQQASYQAALASMSNILQLSLTQFLK
jgi:flagellar hook-associated protein 3 FlgL